MSFKSPIVIFIHEKNILYSTLHIIVYLISVWYPYARDTSMKVCMCDSVNIHFSFIIRRYLLLPNKITSLF